MVEKITKLVRKLMVNAKEILLKFKPLLYKVLDKVAKVAKNRNVKNIEKHFSSIGYFALFGGGIYGMTMLISGMSSPRFSTSLIVFDSTVIPYVIAGLAITLLGALVILINRSFDSIHENTQHSKEMLELMKQK